MGIFFSPVCLPLSTASWRARDYSVRMFCIYTTFFVSSFFHFCVVISNISYGKKFEFRSYFAILTNSIPLYSWNFFSNSVPHMSTENVLVLLIRIHFINTNL